MPDYDPILEIDVPALAAYLDKHNLMDKPPRVMNRDDICSLAEGLARYAHGFSLPAWKERNGERTLIIPRDAPASYKPWLSKNDGRAVLSTVLESLNATEDEKLRYLG